jgi:hypothetical protein
MVAADVHAIQPLQPEAEALEDAAPAAMEMLPAMIPTVIFSTKSSTLTATPTYPLNTQQAARTEGFSG